MNRKILIMGLSGSGKTTLAGVLAPLLGAVVFNGDAVRGVISRDLGFSHDDRIEHARRMGWLCDRVVEAGGYAIADFICPSAATRAAFGPAFVIWCDRVQESRFEDTDRLFEPPLGWWDVRVGCEGTPGHWAEKVRALLVDVFNPTRPTALFVGRWQPFHDGHRALIEQGLRRVGQACIAVRDMECNSENPLAFEAVKRRIELALAGHAGRFIVVSVPNISHVFYGRDVGYAVERLVLPAEVEEISGTVLRGAL